MRMYALTQRHMNNTQTSKLGNSYFHGGTLLCSTAFVISVSTPLFATMVAIQVGREARLFLVASQISAIAVATRRVMCTRHHYTEQNR